jgi:hypothetical protein
MTVYGEERIGELLRLLRAVPQAWVQAAQELPQARTEVDRIVVRAEQDAAFRARLVADLEAALEAEGYEASPAVLAAVRARLKVAG